MAKMAASFDVLCIQYCSSKKGVCNIAVFTKWDDRKQKFQIVDNVEAPDFGVIDDRILSVAVDTFFDYGRTAFEGADYMEDDEIQEMFDEYVSNCFTDKTATFCEWTRAMVYVTLEVSV